MKTTNFFARLLSKLSTSNNNNTNNTSNTGNNTISVFSFDEIGTIQHFELCKNVVSASRKAETMHVYSLEDITKAKQMLSDFRKNHKTDNDRFLTIIAKANAKTDTASFVATTNIAHTVFVQQGIKAEAKKALNYAIAHAKGNSLVTISEIKQAFEDLTDTDIYRYYSVSTMLFNAKGLLAKCVKNAIDAKAKAAKAETKSTDTSNTGNDTNTDTNTNTSK